MERFHKMEATTNTVNEATNLWLDRSWAKRKNTAITLLKEYSNKITPNDIVLNP